MPIHAVLQASGYTVAWDIATNTMSANTPKKNESKYVPYSTSSLKTLLNNIVKGNVVCINGQYYATAEYANSFNGIRMKKDNRMLFFKIEDLKAKNLY